MWIQKEDKPGRGGWLSGSDGSKLNVNWVERSREGIHTKEIIGANENLMIKQSQIQAHLLNAFVSLGALLGSMCTEKQEAVGTVARWQIWRQTDPDSILIATWYPLWSRPNRWMYLRLDVFIVKWEHDYRSCRIVLRIRGDIHMVRSLLCLKIVSLLSWASTAALP